MANLRVIANDPSGHITWTRDTSKVCSKDSPALPSIGGDSRLDVLNVGMPGYKGPGVDRFERRIPANVALRLGVSTQPLQFGQSRQSSWSCRIRFGFVPTAGANYEVFYDFAPGRCEVRVDELIGRDGSLTRRVVRISREPLTCAVGP